MPFAHEVYENMGGQVFLVRMDDKPIPWRHRRLDWLGRRRWPHRQTRRQVRKALGAGIFL